MGARLAAAGRGKFHLGQNSEINVTPFVDVMLVLLIIFMVALPADTRDIKLDLPPAKAPQGPVREPVVITVRPDGSIFVDGRPSSLETLSRDLATALDTPRPTRERVFVRGERSARYRQFMDVLNALHAAGYEQIGLVTEDL